MAKEREGKGLKKKYCKLCLEKVGFVDYKDDKRLRDTASTIWPKAASLSATAESENVSSPAGEGSQPPQSALSL